MTPAARLLAAADLLDKRAASATPELEIDDIESGLFPEDIAYIATMHPEVGKALAKVLRAWAKIVRLDEDLIHRIGGDETLALADLLLAGGS